jgi:hypothetical protein
MEKVEEIIYIVTMENFENLIDKNKYQVFLLCCPAYAPFSFAVHPLWWNCGELNPGAEGCRKEIYIHSALCGFRLRNS